MLERFSFSDRAYFLAALMVIGALADYWRNGRTASRYKEYALIWLAGLIGCVMGATTDLLTSSISPAYFVLGKGILDGDGFKQRVLIFGLQHGLSAGVIVGAVCVYVSRRKSKYPPLGFGELGRFFWFPIIGALAGALLLPFIGGHSDPAGLNARFYEAGLASQLNQSPVLLGTNSILLVWWIHTGLYAGLLIGLLWLIVKVVWRRRQIGETPAPKT